jgi:hypothetical protein
MRVMPACRQAFHLLGDCLRSPNIGSWQALLRPLQAKKERRPGRSSNPDQGAPTNSTGRRPISGRSGQVLLRWFKSQTAQVGRFRESRYLTLARRSSCVHGRSLASVTPRAVLQFLEFVRAGFPASSQSSASIIRGCEGHNPPTPQNSWRRMRLSAPPKPSSLPA